MCTQEPMVIEVGPEVGHGWRGVYLLDADIVEPISSLAERFVKDRA